MAHRTKLLEPPATLPSQTAAVTPAQLASVLKPCLCAFNGDYTTPEKVPAKYLRYQYGVPKSYQRVIKNRQFVIYLAMLMKRKRGAPVPVQRHLPFKMPCRRNDEALKCYEPFSVKA